MLKMVPNNFALAELAELAELADLAASSKGDTKKHR